MSGNRAPLSAPKHGAGKPTTSRDDGDNIISGKAKEEDQEGDVLTGSKVVTGLVIVRRSGVSPIPQPLYLIAALGTGKTVSIIM